MIKINETALNEYCQPEHFLNDIQVQCTTREFLTCMIDKDLEKKLIEKSPFVKTKTQDEINNTFKNRLSQYIPSLKNIDYNTMTKLPEIRELSEIINTYSNKFYRGNIKILDYWNNLEIKAIKYKGNIPVAILKDDKEIYIRPKELAKLIKYNLNLNDR
jgi:hypothetical protein